MPVVTLSDMTSRLATRLGIATADLASGDAKAAINWAKKRVQRKIDLYWTEKAGSFSTSPGKSTYSLSSIASDYHKAYQLWIVDGTSRFMLEHVTRRTQAVRYPPVSGQSSQTPTAWTRWGTDVILMPVAPDKVYTITFDYWAYLPDFSADGDNDSLSNNHDDLILAGAAMELCKDRKWRDEAQAWRADFLEELRDEFFDQVEEEGGGGPVISRGPNVGVAGLTGEGRSMRGFFG